MKLFDPRAKCPKCDSTRISIKYCKGSTTFHRCPSNQTAGEHLDRTCQRCGYCWAERTNDYKQPHSPMPDMKE